MEKQDALKLFKKLASSYPSWKVDRDIAENWLEELLEADSESCWANAKEHIKESKFAPSIAEIVKPNARIAAEREKQRTREMLDEQDRLRQTVPSDPPWKREGISKEEWMRRTIAEHKANKS
ncbi:MULTISPECIES: hypothetical protein [Paenibacillus]|uniref:Loader and inhibitor of G40P protein n=1 Tax=Paenibacillus pabuli TaxID=1472 RepID=A0A855XW84_9BACL|nr:MULTISPECIES: hypothetical protein [Paenibacillus]PWW37352.1 loader and inhibitor of G40P protein [Paenibacillus pabuli]PXW05494.1 loader and inhibitor of G40P protein [Paenibacillus taichungensis]